MPRYYTLCLATPTQTDQDRNAADVKHTYVYPAAGQGYLFHDTEGLSDARQVHKTLWVLSSLYPSGKSVFIVRIDSNTLMASFNTNSFPKPVRVGVKRWVENSKGYEWLQKNQLTGWFIEDVRRVDTPIELLYYDEIYDRCAQLERMVGSCPCPRLAAGTCFADTAFRRLPALEDNLVDFGQLTPEMHRVQRYKEIDGFEYVPSLYCIEGAFVEALRPWDNYDFSLVETRRAEFKTRGSQNKQRNLFRKEKCAECAFQRKQEGWPTDCGQIEKCVEPSSISMVAEALETWTRKHTPFLEGSEGFTRGQIAYLAEMTGKQFSSRMFVKTGTSMAYFAGFSATTMLGNHLAYRVVPATGDLHRSEYFYSYADMVDKLPGLPEDVGYPYGRDWQHIVQAVLATQRSVPRMNDFKYLRIHHLEISYWCVTVYGIHGRKIVKCLELEQRDYAAVLYQLLWPGGQPLAGMYAETPLAYPNIARDQPNFNR